ncbi:helix-turn-helix domain-containing protein [Thalassotalea fusca]
MSKPTLDFELFQPSGRLSTFIQGIWSASVAQPGDVVKRLFSDAGSGIIFNLSGEVKIGDKILPEGVIMLPIHKKAEHIVIPSGTRLAGIRFHPASGYGVIGQHFDKPTLLSPEQDQRYNLYQVYFNLRSLKDNGSLVEAIYSWVDKNLDFNNMIPDSLAKAMECIKQNKTPGQLSNNNDLSQRQIERLFKLWLKMTPKRFQRILRMQKTISFIRQQQNVDLADVAQRFGYSDQAHMTRECRSIASTTPGQV